MSHATRNFSDTETPQPVQLSVPSHNGGLYIPVSAPALSLVDSTASTPGGGLITLANSRGKQIHVPIQCVLVPGAANDNATADNSAISQALQLNQSDLQHLQDVLQQQATHLQEQQIQLGKPI